MIDAGDATAWVGQIRAALSADGAADVPCAGCTACCRSAQFVPIAPDETRTLARIPADLLFPVPGRPGHVLLGYDERGHCPMLVDDRCSVYADRPRACRVYDCRVFAATGVVPDDKPLVAAQVARWRFGGAEGAELPAMRAAARWLVAHRESLPAELVPADPTRLAVLAVRLHELFLDPATPPAEDVVRAEIERATGR